MLARDPRPRHAHFRRRSACPVAQGRILYTRTSPSRARRGAWLSPVTVGERILVHLSWYLRYSDAFECPRETTQDGIADALRISRAHAALELKRLRAASKAEERMAHVAGARSRRKVYFLTPSGAGDARALRDHARPKPV